MGAENKVIGVTTYCQTNEKKEIIGTLLEPNIEKIVAMQPDLIIATKEGNRKQAVEKLKEIGIEVYIMNAPENFEQVCRGFSELAKVVNRQKQADAIVTECKLRVTFVKTQIEDEEPVNVFWQIGTNPVFTVNSKTFVNDFFKLAGGVNIFGDMKMKYPKVTREEVIKRNPDVIMMTTMGNVTEQEEKYWRKFKNMNAVKNNRIYVLDEELFTNPTPTSMAEGIEKIKEILWGQTPAFID